jgi:pyridoxine 4-dehydrogenase
MTTTLVGKKVGTTGFGLMGLSWRPKPQPVEESIKVMKAALEKGANFWYVSSAIKSPNIS